jgi:hypothetical protein
MPSAEHIVPVASPSPADAATRRIPKAAAPAASLLLGLWPLSLLANASTLAMGSMPLLEMSSTMVPTVMSHPLLVGTLVDLVFGGLSLAQLAKSFGSRTIFRRLTLMTLLPLSSYESSLSMESIQRCPPPQLAAACAFCSQGGRVMMPLPLAPSCKGSRPRSPACYPCCQVWLLSGGFDARRSRRRHRRNRRHLRSQPRRWVPLWRMRAPSRGQGRRGVTPLCLAPPFEGSRPRSPDATPRRQGG